MTANRDFRAVALICLTVIAVNFLPLTGFLDSNPLLHRSGLAVQKQDGPLPGTHTIDPNDGFTSHALGSLAAKKVWSGDVPLWNKYEGIGAPLAAEMQSAALFPPVWFFLRFDQGLLYMHVFLEMIAGIGTFLFFRKIGISRTGSAVFAIVFAINGTFSWITNAAFNPIAFLPWILLGVELLYAPGTRKQKKIGMIMLAVSGALSMYAGFPETVFVYGLLVLLWAILRFFSLVPSQRKAFLLQVLTGGVAALCLAAPILVLFLTYLPEAYTGSHGAGLESGYISVYGVPALLLPYIYGPIFAYNSASLGGALIGFWSNVGGFVTFSAALLPIIGLWTRKIQKRYVIALAIFSTVVILRIYGMPLLVAIINLIPGMDLIAFYRYAWPALIFAVLILAGFGFDVLQEKRLPKTRRHQLVMVGAAGVAFLIVATLITYRLNMGMKEFGSLRIASAVSLVAGASILVAVLLAVANWLPKRTVVIFLSLLVVGESALMYIVPQFSTDTTKGMQQGSVEYLKQNLGENRFYTLGPIEPNYGSFYGIKSLNQNDLPVPKIWAEYITKNLNTNTDPILFTGAFQLDLKGVSPKEAFFANIKNYEYVGVKYLVAPPGLVTGADVEEQHIQKVYSDEVAEVFLLSSVRPYIEVTEGSCTLTSLKTEAFEATCSAPSAILRRELALPGWTARTAEVDIPINVAGDIFQKIDLSAGKHTVVFTYKPEHLTSGYVLFGVGLLAIFVVAALPSNARITWPSRRRSKQKS